jgi:hypothetical protein
MEDTIIEIIRSRVRRISSTNKIPEGMSAANLKCIVRVQRWWRRHMLYRTICRRIRQIYNRRQVLVELVSTEREYIKDLKMVCEDVMKPLAQVIDEEMHEMLFLNIPEILTLHEQFLLAFDQMLANFNPYKSQVSQCIL